MHIGARDGLRPAAGRRRADARRACARRSPTRLATLPRYSPAAVLDRGTGGLSWPRWDRRRALRRRDHIRRAALPAPGGEQELVRVGGRLLVPPARPDASLWEMVLLEGLEDGRWALGRRPTTRWSTASARSASCSFCSTSSPEPGEPRRPMLDGPDRAMGGARHRRPPGRSRRRCGTIGHAASATLHAALHPREALERSRALVEVLVRDELSASPHDHA